MSRNLILCADGTCNAFVDNADGDTVFLFGFSRGAFTVRALAGLMVALRPSSDERRRRAAAEAIAARPASAVALTKALMRDPAALAARMELEGGHFAAQLKSAEAREAFAAFAEKRAPDFSKVSQRSS